MCLLHYKNTNIFLISSHIFAPAIFYSFPSVLFPSSSSFTHHFHVLLLLSLFFFSSSSHFFFLTPQAAYLVGVSDPNSQAGHQGLVDPIQFAKANQAIQMACQNLVDPDSSPSQVTDHCHQVTEPVDAGLSPLAYKLVPTSNRQFCLMIVLKT